MRLLFVSHSFPPAERPLSNVGGMQRMATELYEALRAHPEMIVFPHLLRTTWRSTHLRVVPFLARSVMRLPRIVAENRIDAVLFSSMVTAAMVPLVRGRAGRDKVKWAATPVGRDATLPVWPYQEWLPKVFAALDLVLPISRATAAECEQRGATAAQIEVVPPGVDPARFPPVKDRTAARQELVSAVAGHADAPPPDALLLCSVGRHIERKGFDWFVDQVMPRLPPTVHFWLAGEGPTTPLIRAATSRHDLGGRVRLLGRIPDAELLRMYRGADLFVMPNRSVPGDIEGFGIVMLEAGMCGLPTVGTRIEGIRDAITEGKNGVLVPAGDAAGCAAAIRRFHDDRSRLAELSERAADFTRRAFAWPVIADRYLEHLRAARTAYPSR